jgi:hypothetical protein
LRHRHRRKHADFNSSAASLVESLQKAIESKIQNKNPQIALAILFRANLANGFGVRKKFSAVIFEFARKNGCRHLLAICRTPPRCRR